MKNRVISLFLAIAVLCICFTSCARKVVNPDADVAEVYQLLVDTGYVTSMIPEPERDLLEIYGIDMTKVEKAVYYKSGNSATNADEIAIFKLSDSSYSKELSDIFKARLKRQANMAQSYSPYEYNKIKKSKVIRVGNFVYFVVNDEYSALMKILEENIG